MNTLVDVVASALATQAPSGAFLSTVHIDGKSLLDENAFVTALVVHELSRWKADNAIREAIERGLDFLLRCESSERPGHFCFYPEDAHPAWMSVRLPPDSDDTALCAWLLVRHGRRPAAFSREVVEGVLDRFRVLYVAEGSEPWHRVGVYLTWLQAGYPRNVVDCCVNVSILSLLYQSKLEDSASCTAIVNMLEAAIECAGPVTARAKTLSPWYPHPRELVHAVERAVSAGVDRLGPALARMRGMPWGRARRRPTEPAPVCGSRDGRIVWTCAALQELRALNGSADLPSSTAALHRQIKRT
jgi:hypothetical protein